jgi:PAS domain S-box-containing protein
MIYEKIRETYNGDLANMLLEVLNTAQDGIVTIDENNIIVMVNETSAELFGFEPDEMLGKDLSLIFPKYVKKTHHNFVKDFYLNIKDQTHTLHAKNCKELEGLKKSGEAFPCEVSISKGVYKGNKYFTAIVRDISERVNYEEKIRQQEDELAKYRIAKKAELLNQVQRVKAKRR